MSKIHIDGVIAVLPVKNQEKAIAWYKNLLGRDSDIIPAKGVAEWHLSHNSWLQITTNSTDLDQLGKAKVMISVNNLEKQINMCDEANIERSTIVEYSEFIKTFNVIDPDGNKISFVQDISYQH